MNGFPICRSHQDAAASPQRPNYFLALQLSNFPAVTAAITAVQTSLTEHSPAVQAALVDPESAHMTLMVAALHSEEEVQKAVAAMEALPAKLKEHEHMLDPLCIHLEGLSHFRQQVHAHVDQTFEKTSPIPS